MNQYNCKLIQSVNNKKIVKENFYRDGNSVEEVRDSLEMFEWPKGKWEIELA